MARSKLKSTHCPFQLLSIATYECDCLVCEITGFVPHEYGLIGLEAVTRCTIFQPIPLTFFAASRRTERRAASFVDLGAVKHAESYTGLGSSVAQYVSLCNIPENQYTLEEIARCGAQFDRTMLESTPQKALKTLFESPLSGGGECPLGCALEGRPRSADPATRYPYHPNSLRRNIDPRRTFSPLESLELLQVFKGCRRASSTGCRCLLTASCPCHWPDSWLTLYF